MPSQSLYPGLPISRLLSGTRFSLDPVPSKQPDLAIHAIAVGPIKKPIHYDEVFDKEYVEQRMKNIADSLPHLGERPQQTQLNETQLNKTQLNKILSQTYHGMNFVPGVGHIKGVVLYIYGDKKGGDEAMNQSSRSLGVIGCSVIGCATLGPIGAIAGGIAGGQLVDGLTTGIESAVEGKFTPYGSYVYYERLFRDPYDVSALWSAAQKVVKDGAAGYSFGEVFSGQLSLDSLLPDLSGARLLGSFLKKIAQGQSFPWSDLFPDYEEFASAVILRVPDVDEKKRVPAKSTRDGGPHEDE